MSPRSTAATKDEYLELVREWVAKKGGVLLSNEYVSAKSKLRVRCGEGHQFAISSDNLRYGKLGLALVIKPRTCTINMRK